ncbi:hypothetical protein [Streptomyces sp. NPDC059466]|uniref:hypothetical protein n=1 Tax=unclassified Streptomyces TaxID=2593676 RepID=UPI0036B9FC41
MRDDPTHRHDAAIWSPLDTDDWCAARNATTALRDALLRAGLEKDSPYLQSDLNTFGHGLVELGRVSPATVERLAELLRLALSAGPRRLEESGDRASEHRVGED